MVTDAKDFELLGDPAKMTGYSRPPESKLTAATRVLGVCTAVALLLLTSAGMQVGMMSPYLSKFTTENSLISLTMDEASWVVSTVEVGRVLGAILSSITVQYFGSKRTMLINALLLLLPWICLLFANSAIWMHTMAFFYGITTGISFAASPIYIGEVDIARIIAMTMMFVSGATVGWSSPYMAQFTSGDSPFPVTVNEIAWMVSVYQLGRLPGAILGTICVQYFGSKTVMVGNGCVLVISWILVILANSVSWLYVSRFIGGASLEIVSISLPLYLADISSSSIRGALVTLALNGLVIGILAGNVIGHYLSMKLFACVILVPNICVLLALLWLPHSPYYLISKGKIKDAEKSISGYNPTANIQLEVESIENFLALSNSITVMDRLRELNIPQNRNSGIIIMALIMFAHCSGVNPVAAYMESIMIRSMLTVIAPSTVPMITNGIGIVAGWVLMYFVEKYGRRIMWVISSAGICGAMTALGIHFYLIGDGFDPPGLQWLPIFSMISFKIFYNMGLSSVPSILLSELFVSDIRPLASFGAALTSAIFASLSINGYEFLMGRIDEAYVWWIHAIIMWLSLIFGWLLVPEMKGKTLLEIQNG